MLKTIGVSSIDELFSDITPDLRTKSFDLPDEKSEFEVLEYFNTLSQKNATQLKNFSGGGFYDHYIPAVVDSLSSRPEFYTAYTPYQAECSQGTLQSLYEYQTSICRITGMDAANASVYDGGTALAEAILMTQRITRRKKILIDSSINPLYRQIINTYLKNLQFELIELDQKNYAIDRTALENNLDENTAAIVFQNPNFFGSIDDYSDIVEKAHNTGALAISSTYPISLGFLKTPSQMGVDIATGEGQSLGNPLNFGGPYLGFIAVQKKHVRNLPGRIAGQTVDENGKRGFVLTLQAREQHIRRHKATSNICTNQNLCALRALIYLTSIGKQGFKEIAQQNYDKANYAKDLLTQIDGVALKNIQPVFNEFTIELSQAAQDVYAQMLKSGFSAGILLGKFYQGLQNHLLICVTEKTTIENITAFRDTLSEVLK